MGTTRTCPRCGNHFSGILDLCPNDRTPLFAPEVVARIGMLLKDHEIQGVIGVGGMGVVYRAQHVVLEKPVAIKVLHDQFARQTEAVEQFILEAKAASRIRHPHIIDVTDIGTTPEGMVFLVMEYLEGENLEDRLRRVGRLSVFDAVNIVGQVARGLGAAHELGIVHRDLKPANIFLVSREGRRRVVRRSADQAGVRFAVEPEGNYDMAKLLDFGVAKFLDLGPGAATRAGAICGTPYYLSPEQAQERPAEVRSDIYSLGAVFYEMLTGVVPFAGKSMLEILNGHVSGVVVPPSQRAPAAGIDERTDAVVLRCLAKNPQDRFANTDDLGDALRDCVGDRVYLRDAERLPGLREGGAEFLHSIPNARQRASSSQELMINEGPSDPSGADNDDEFSVHDGSVDRDELASLDAFDPDGFSSTMSIRSLRAQGRRRLMIAVAIVILVGAGSAFFALRRNSTEVQPPVPVAEQPPVVAQPVALPMPAAAPAALPAAPGPVPAAMPSAPSTTSSLPVSGKPSRRGRHEESAYRSPAAFPSYPVPTFPPEPVPSVQPVPEPAVPAAAPAPVPARPAGDAVALVRDAQQAWLRNHYAAAIEKARAALEVDPGQVQAYQIIGACSCVLHNIEDAQQAASHLDPGRRKLVRSLCEKNGVDLGAE